MREASNIFFAPPQRDSMGGFRPPFTGLGGDTAPLPPVYAFELILNKDDFTYVIWFQFALPNLYKLKYFIEWFFYREQVDSRVFKIFKP